MLEQISNKFDVYKVGGCVRDKFIGIAPKDVDYCVVASEQEFENHFQLRRVGSSFPVYLNSKCGSEIALTRTELNVGNRYQDFSFKSGVSIEDDLGRRDFTINSIAEHFTTGCIVDPFNGICDIENKVIRCVNNNAFKDDPLRILRGVRFACRFNFHIDYKTIELMYESRHRLKDIKPERFELELRKTYEQSVKPSKFFRFLRAFDSLKVIFPELDKACGVPAGRLEYHPEGSVFNHLMNSFDKAKKYGYSYEVAIAALLHDLGKLGTPVEELPRHVGHDVRIEILEGFFKKHRFSSHVVKLSKVVFANHMRFHVIEDLKPGKVIKFVKLIPKYLRSEFVRACNCDSLLNENMLTIFERGCKAVDTVVINIPETIVKNKKAIVDYVLCKTCERYIDLKKEG